jgi:hypothetical protein
MQGQDHEGDHRPADPPLAIVESVLPDAVSEAELAGAVNTAPRLDP